MSREIKFRAWHKEEKRMAEVALLQMQPFMLVHIVSLGDEHGLDDTVSTWKQEDIELMQFTGLNDKNGKEIYEGDIVRYIHPAQYDLPSITTVVVISWNEETTGFDLGHMSNRVTIDDDIEVIGNIYENKDLLT
jgi:uncharacterized phage protein (TIGR01671 family)